LQIPDINKAKALTLHQTQGPLSENQLMGKMGTDVANHHNRQPAVKAARQAKDNWFKDHEIPSLRGHLRTVRGNEIPQEQFDRLPRDAKQAMERSPRGEAAFDPSWGWVEVR